MDSVPRILFGAAFTGLTSLSLGLLIVQALRLPLSRRESRLIGFLLGSAALSTLVLLSAALWIVKPVWFVALGVSAVAACTWRGAWRYGGPPVGDPLPLRWHCLFAAVMLVFGIFSFAHAMAPETSPDGSTYHLGTVARYLREGGLSWQTTNMYANMPMGVEMLFLFAFAFGTHSAAALVHWQFLLALPLLMLALGRRFGVPKAGAVGGLIMFCCPLAAVDGSSAYVDIATAAVVFGAFYLLLVYEQTRAPGLPFVIGALAGFAYTCKMTAFAAVPFALAWIVWTSWKARSPWLRPAVLSGIAAAAVMTPWLVKSAVMVGNPFSPFLNNWFPNPYVHISFEQGYRESLRTYYGQVTSASRIPLEVTVRGGPLQGFLGPVFLLAPIALLSLRSALGRRLLLAAAVYLAAYPTNIGTRFLLTAAPFVTMALGATIAPWRGIATIVVLFAAWTSWPPITRIYADEHAWRFDRFRLKQALRRESADAFLTRTSSGYAISKLIDKHVPPNGKVLTYAGPAEAYTSRDVLVVYQGGLNQVLGDILAAGLSADYQPIHAWTFKFAGREVRRLRLVQTKASPQEWTIAELHVFAARGEFRPDNAWRLRAAPNPWDVQFAFDRCPVTRWKTWEPSRAGMSVEIDFGRTIWVDTVRADVPPDQSELSARLEVETPAGKWETASEAPERTSQPTIANARRVVMEELKRLGITHLAMQDSDEFISKELYLNRAGWGVTLAAEGPGIKLYSID
jgi:hypothetical protein